jgi:choline dehydrogenase-like flavoprotein
MSAETPFADRVNDNQRRLASDVKGRYDFIVCGSGSSGSVVAGRLAEDPDVNVLLLEAGLGDAAPSMQNPSLWPTLLGTDRDWGYFGEPNPAANGRRVPFSAGKVLGGGSSINVMAWVRGHMNDWNDFAAESGNDAWCYDNVLEIYRRIEDWQGIPDPKRRGTGGLVYVQPAHDPHPVALAFVEGAAKIGIPTFDNPNGALLESDSGAAIADVRIREGRRESVFRTYVYPLMDRPNLTVLTNAFVTEITVEAGKATGVQFTWNGAARSVGASTEVVVSLGAMNTPKLLMQSGIGDSAELRQFGISVKQHLPGVGRNFQDHAAFGCVWESSADVPPPRNNLSEAIAYGKTRSDSTAPDVFIWPPEVPLTTPENTRRFGVPDAGWTLFGAVTRPKSRGRIRLTGADPRDPIRIEDGLLSHPDDLRLAIECVQMCREIGNSAPLQPFSRREVMPGDLEGAELEEFVRNGTSTFWHQSGTAKMGLDEMSVVDGDLRVYGIENLRIADASVMPRITTANTMAPSVVIGERAADALLAER